MTEDGILFHDILNAPGIIAISAFRKNLRR